MRALRRHFRHAINAGCAPRMAAQDASQRHPRTGPESISVERLVGIFGTSRQMPAMEADQRRERVAVNLYEPAAGEARGVQQVHASGPLPFVAIFSLEATPDEKPVSAFPGVAPTRFASIWLIASTTASNVSSVEACLAL